MEHIAGLLTAAPAALLTGAGISTDSGIPDYRGAGAPVRSPMRFQDFLADPDYRRRYWAGARLGAGSFDRLGPNPGHREVARLERTGFLTGVVTQNVDGLHRAGGASRVVELHGNGASIRCLDCGHRFSRAEVLGWIDRDNPWLATDESVTINPDGDAETANYRELTLPECPDCGGTLRPDVVFFGEFVPTATFADAAAIVDEAASLIVAGSSLAVNSGIRLVERAARAGKPLVIINRGPTKADARALVRVEGGTSEVFSALVDALVRRAAGR
ncbi:Sir2 family NAD-dependent protein deacetylase [Leucobacter sp. M11]|uniref:Sir2 family NAD-dependent protein deacetylase n=1 Tax=Leucobacter sp. M11 TaxID=2993565 RepID=UPI003FA60902